MNYDQAEVLGLLALTHMAENHEILTAYLNLSGITPEELKKTASDPLTLASILDYFLQNEKRLIAFCEPNNIPPEQLVKARSHLPGAETPPYSP